MLPDPPPEAAPQLDELVRKAKPRYHFTSCGGKFWEREPFCWVEENNRATRFVSLGAFGNQPAEGKKERVSVTSDFCDYVLDSILFPIVVLCLFYISWNSHIGTTTYSS